MKNNYVYKIFSILTITFYTILRFPIHVEAYDNFSIISSNIVIVQEQEENKEKFQNLMRQDVETLQRFIKKFDNLQFLSTSVLSTEGKENEVVTTEISPSGELRFVEPEDFTIKTLTRTRKPSLFVDALQTINYRTRYPNRKPSPLEFPFNWRDPQTQLPIRPSSVVHAVTGCAEKLSDLPRDIDKKDKKIVYKNHFKTSYINRYQSVFGHNLTNLTISYDYITKKPKQVSKAELKLFKKNRSNAIKCLQEELFENPYAMKFLNREFRHTEGCTIYYNCLTNLFGVVKEDNNELIEFANATTVDFVDMFKYNKLYSNQTRINDLEFTLPNFHDGLKPIQIPKNFDPEKGWWADAESQLVDLLGSKKVDMLSPEYNAAGNIENAENQRIEAIGVLQAEMLGHLSKPRRPPLGDNLYLDYDVDNVNPHRFKGIYAEAIKADLKSGLDPEVARLRGEKYETLEDMVNNMLRSIKSQRQRARDNNVVVVHIIDLLRIRPSDRSKFMLNFFQKTQSFGIDPNGIEFMNASPLEIVDLGRTPYQKFVSDFQAKQSEILKGDSNP